MSRAKGVMSRMMSAQESRAAHWRSFGIPDAVARAQAIYEIDRTCANAMALRRGSALAADADVCKTRVYQRSERFLRSQNRSRRSPIERFLGRGIGDAG